MATEIVNPTTSLNNGNVVDAMGYVHQIAAIGDLINGYNDDLPHSVSVGAGWAIQTLAGLALAQLDRPSELAGGAQ